METTQEKQFITLQLVANSYTVREDMMDGKLQMIVPVMMMVEGVHDGSHGPILHTETELAKWTEAWDGIPVTISHPKKDKKNVSANSPEQLTVSTVGRIFETRYDGGLKAEAWIDVEKIKEISPDAYETIFNERNMEVSVGVFNDTELTEGEWDGETYVAIAHNYRPDHLALLPDEVGACSNNDGCGLRVNKKGVAVKELLTTFQELSQKGYVVSLINNKQGYREIQEALSAKLSDLNTDGKYHYIEEVYDDHIIYSAWVDGGGDTLYKQAYDMDNDNNIVFDGMRAEVRKKVDYVTMEMRRKNVNTNNANEGGTMSKDGSLCCEAKVDALIANARTHWQATDREWLLTQSEAIVSKMTPMDAEKVEQSAEEIKANNEAVIADYNASKESIEDYTAGMPEAMKVAVEGGVKLYNEHKETLVKSIITNTAEGLWKEDVLNAMDDETLENVSKSIKQPADYSGQAAGSGGGAVADTSGEQVEVPVEYAARKEVVDVK